MEMELTLMQCKSPAMAVDTKKEYAEVDLGQLTPGKRTWKAPYESDWALAVGRFER